MKPYYKLDLTAMNQITGRIKQCEILNLGNISFEYYAAPKRNAATFRMEQNKYGWELVVRVWRSGTTDTYKIVDDKVTHDYSEKD